MAIAFGKDGMLVKYSILWVITISVIWTSSSVLLAIISQKIDKNKNLFIGKGISLLLLTNILSSFPSNIKEIYMKYIADKDLAIVFCILGILGLLFLFSIISFLHEVEKRIVISYSSNIVYENKGEIGLKQILPIKLMPASVMPVIFTSTLFSLPLLIGAFAEGKDLEWVKFFNTAFWFNPDNIVYSIGCVAYILLIFIFSYFYINVFLNPYEIAEDLQKAGGLINGLKTNTDVAEYLKKHIYTMTLCGAIILSIISIIPFILSGMIGLSQMSFLGTSVLIIVSATIETYKDIKSSRIVESHINKTGGLFDDKIKN
jgi:preprotein translocase subunit SecY